MKILLPTLTIIILLTLMYTFLSSIANNPEYDTVSEECDMKGILNGINKTQENLTNCNYN